MSPAAPNEPTRFLPGAMIAARYRVVALLGRGGMGEVYRADDIKLGEAVALKFLPERLEDDVSLRERFLGEAKLARQVAHPNVCRVYDLGEIDGRLFLSMEYVDGEDLATLLRRIGRLPQEKAVQLAQQMCAGLQAAHEQGIVHRDLKPANIMIDGRGRARITDFGLAAVAASVTGREAAAGTPAYMAPEQLLGQEASVRSDVYALGLVLYELFTGRPAFEAHTWAEQISVKQSRTPSSPTLLAPGLDPAIERIVLRCLLPDPNLRPSSAAAVALALPGGDPLAAALAAGETPSPEMVAQAGGDVRFPGAVAWGWFSAFVVGLVAMFVIAPHAYFLQQVPIAKPPAVLVYHAREMAQALGWTEPPRDEWSALENDGTQAQWLTAHTRPGTLIERLRRFRGGSVDLRYRRSPLVMTPMNALGWTPTAYDPPLTRPGMLTLTLDDEGRLLSLEACPAERDTVAAGAAADWPRLFALAGLDTAAFRAVAPEWTPPAYADRRAAWVGRVPGDTALSLRIEAASFHGRPVMFRPIYPWTPVPGAGSRAPSLLGRVLPWAIWIVFLGLLGLAAWAARKNLHEGRADTRGALRMATAAALIGIAGAWASMHWASDANLFAGRVLNVTARGGLIFLVTSVLYLTLEPVIRRTWPTMLISWVRLLDGRLRDSLLGRDVLAGLVLGLGMQILSQAGAAAWALGGRGVPEFTDNPYNQVAALSSTGQAILIVMRAVLGALQAALTWAALAALGTQLTQRRVPGLVFAGLLMLLIQFGEIGGGTYSHVLILVVILSGIVIMVRFGFVTTLAFLMAQTLLSDLPLARPGGSWYWPTSAVAVVVLGGLALWSLRCMLAAPAHAVSYEDLRRTLRATTASAVSRASGAPVSGAGSAHVATPAPAAPTPSGLPTEMAPPRSPASQLPTEYAPPGSGSGPPAG